VVQERVRPSLADHLGGRVEVVVVEHKVRPLDASDLPQHGAGHGVGEVVHAEMGQPERSVPETELAGLCSKVTENVVFGIATGLEQERGRRHQDAVREAEMTKRRVLGCGLLAAAAVVVMGAASAEAAYPERPITIIVPWAAGGSTDQVTRITAGELEKHLGQKVVIVNQPGASGSIGTKSALEAPKDGYTWTAGAAQDLGVYRALGMLETNLADWHLFLSVANVPVVGVNPNTPYKTMKDLLDEMKAKPGEITVATAGVTDPSIN
jgi:hypothetical protein